MEFSSKLLEKAVNEMAQLPGIGKRTAFAIGIALTQTTHRKDALLEWRPNDDARGSQVL